MMANSTEKSCLDVEELPKARLWGAVDIVRWEGFWFSPNLVHPAITFRSTFTARDDDVLLASPMKTGTTWLKSLALSCIRRDDDDHHDVLAADNPHFLVPSVESAVITSQPFKVDIYDASAPRLLHTHLPYSLLPDSIKSLSSSTKIVYIARNPKDTLISMWHFFNSIFMPIPLEKAVDCFCSGVHTFGPFFDHVVGYWRESQKRPEKILFLKYEDLKSDPKAQLSRMAEFIGKPFREEDEVEKVLWRCSLERLKNLEVNKNGKTYLRVANSCFFRKGEVGDWKNYLTQEMEERIDKISRDKLEVMGLFL